MPTHRSEPAVLHRICDQILHGRTQRGRVADDRRKIRGDLTMKRDVDPVEHGHRSIDGALDDVGRGERNARGEAKPGFDTRVLQHAFDHFSQPLGFGLEQQAVSLDAIAGHHTLREILRRGSDHRDRCAQFVSHARDELHLLVRKPMGAPRRRGQQCDADAEQQQDAETRREIAVAARSATAASSDPL
jgi:hypothetical protein